MSESTVRPDEVIDPEGGVGLQLRTLARDAVGLLPNLFKLLTRLLRDPRVPRRSKVLVGIVLAYLVSPIDVLPELIPVVGAIDDLVLVAFTLNHLVASAGEDVVLEHWDGPRDLLEMVRGILDLVGEMIPVRIRRVVDRLAR